MDEAQQSAYLASFEGQRVAEIEGEREAYRQAGFIATIGVRDAAYFGVAIVLAFGLGYNENTAPFVN